MTPGVARALERRASKQAEAAAAAPAKASSASRKRAAPSSESELEDDGAFKPKPKRAKKPRESVDDRVARLHPEVLGVWEELSARAPTQPRALAEPPDGLGTKLLPFQEEGGFEFRLGGSGARIKLRYQARLAHT